MDTDIGRTPASGVLQPAQTVQTLCQEWSDMEGVIAANLDTVRARIAAAARAAGRLPASVALVAVSKTHPTASGA